MIQRQRSLSSQQVMLISLRMPPPIDLLILFLATTGVHISEAAGLRWRHTNLMDAPYSILVAERYLMGHYQAIDKARTVPLPEWLAAQLWVLRAKAGPHDPVFAYGAGGPLDWPGAARRLFKAVLIAMRNDPNVALDLTWVTWDSFRQCRTSMEQDLGPTIIEG